MVVNSHHHYDHAGGNVWFDEVYAHKNAVSVLKEQNCQEVRRAFIERQLDREEYNGEASVADTISYLHEYRVNPIEEGKVFDLGGRKLEVIETFGHTKDGICLLDSENRLLFSGDSVVSTPTLIMDRCKSDTMEHYAKALKHLEGREAEFDLIFPGHYVHPIPKTYLKELIVCAEKILENPLYGTPEKNHMSDQIAYRAFYKKEMCIRDSTQTTAVSEAEGTAKEDLPFSKYAETVTVHLGGSLNPNAKVPNGMSIEDNPYTRFLKDDLNIEVVYDWVASSSDFDEKMNLCIGSGTIPELMNVNAAQYRALLKYDMIQPLDQYFDDYASDTLKGYVESGGEELKKCISNDKGEMMAIPATNITAGGINEMWIRQDWLDNLGLEVPRTWDELVTVAEAFVTQDPDGNGEADTIGILGPSNSDHMNGIGGNQFGLDPLFSRFQSYPQYRLQDEDGTVKYGSIQPETRTALEKIQKLYTDKLIDAEMLVRNDSKEPLLAGKVGIFFGPWWCGYTVGDATMAGEADWRAYFTPLAEDGDYYTHMAEPTSRYVVASKSCKNPEAAFKIISYLVANEQRWVAEGIATTEMNASDLYPLWNTYDNADEIEVSTETLEKYLAGEITMDDVDFSRRKLLKNDMEAVTELKKEPYDDFSLDKWNLDSDLVHTNLPRLVSLLVGGYPLVNDKYIPVYNAYNGQTETMETKWANLKKMEEETFAKIVMGKADISEFDTFVENWKKQGGDQILKEINDELSK